MLFLAIGAMLGWGWVVPDIAFGVSLSLDQEALTVTELATADAAIIHHFA